MLYFRSGNASESEYEDDETNEVVLPQTLNSRGNLENNKSAIRLHEIGPRLTIELIKIQNDLFTGEVLYHNTIIKTEEEIAEMKKLREEKKKLKEQRKRIQAANVAKKEKQKEEHNERSMAGVANPSTEEGEEEQFDNDADYYREEVGEEPDEGDPFRQEIFRAIRAIRYLQHILLLGCINFVIFSSRTVPNVHWRRSQACVRA